MDLYKIFPESSKEALDRVVFPVEMLSLADLGIPSTLTSVSNLSHAIVIDRRKIVNFCSSGYALNTNANILLKVGTVLNQLGITYDFKSSSFKKTRFRMEFVFHAKMINVGRKIMDPVGLALRIYNSYDGNQRYTFHLMMYRLVCLNGMTAPEELMKFSKSHTQQLISLDDLNTERLVLALEHGYNSLEQISDYYSDLQDFRIRNVEASVDGVIDAVKFPVSLKDIIMERIDKEIKMGLPPTAWLIYNGFTYVLNHSNDSLLGRKAEAFDKKVLMYLLGS